MVAARCACLDAVAHQTLITTRKQLSGVEAFEHFQLSRQFLTNRLGRPSRIAMKARERRIITTSPSLVSVVDASKG